MTECSICSGHSNNTNVEPVEFVNDDDGIIEIPVCVSCVSHIEHSIEIDGVEYMIIPF